MAKKQQSAGSMGFPTGSSKGDSRPVVRRRPTGGGKVKADKYGRPQPDSNTGK
jgi:hypothetical protein